MRYITQFEHRAEKVIRPHVFLRRMGRAVGLWLLLAFGGLVIGMIGYAVTEGMGPADAFVNAAMILSGMGPMGELHSTAGKIFAGCYAIFSGLVLIIATGFVLAPIFHRVLHQFHVDSGRDS